MKYLPIIIGLFLLLSSQKYYGQSFDQLKSEAKKSFNSNKFELSLSYFKTIIDRFPEKKDQEILFYYAHLLRLTNQYKKSVETYQKLTQNQLKKEFYSAYFYQAEIYKYLENYKKALIFYKKTKQYFRKNKQSYFYQKANSELFNKNIIKTIYSKNNQERIPLYKYEPTESEKSELSLCFLNDNEIIYTSNNYLNITTNTSLIKLYYKNIKTKTPAKIIKLPKKYDLFHIANPSFDSIKKVLYFSICSDKSNCKIYTGKIIGQQLSNIKELKILSDFSKLVTQPQIVTIKGIQTLFFVSNKNDKNNHLNIWKSEYSNNKFQTPIMLNNNINSIGDEITPFYDVFTKQLYFASNWYTGIGGFDLFSISLNNPMETPKNIEINSSYNDYYPYRYKNKFFLSSNRIFGQEINKSCCNNIYYFKQKIPKLISKKVLERTPIKKITLAQIQKLLPLTLYFDNNYPDPGSQDTFTKISYATLFYDYYNQKENYIDRYAGNSEINKEKIEFFFEHQLKKKMALLKKICYAIKNELDNNENVTILVKGFTSPLAKKEYNKKLASRRISSLKNFIYRFNNSVFIPYLTKKIKNKGVLKIKSLPIGELKSNGINDQLNNLKESVYSPEAAKTRKIVIQRIEKN